MFENLNLFHSAPRRPRDLATLISDRSDVIYDLVQIDTARIFGDHSEKEAALERIKHYEHDLRDACRLKHFDLFKILVDAYLNESIEHDAQCGHTLKIRLISWNRFFQ